MIQIHVGFWTYLLEEFSSHVSLFLSFLFLFIFFLFLVSLVYVYKTVFATKLAFPKVERQTPEYFCTFSFREPCPDTNSLAYFRSFSLLSPPPPSYSWNFRLFAFFLVLRISFLFFSFLSARIEDVSKRKSIATIDRFLWHKLHLSQSSCARKFSRWTFLSFLSLFLLF